MVNQLFTFQWTVPSQGYRWVRVPLGDVDRVVREPGRGWVLSENPSPGWRVGEGPPWKTYHPLQEFTGLYRQFAALPPTREGILEFANRFGLLGTIEYVGLPLGAPLVSGEEWSRPETRGERLANWTKHIQEMKDAVEVWDRLATGDIDGLRQLERSRQLFSKPPRYWEDDALSYYRDPTNQELVSAGRLLDPAVDFVLQMVNSHLVRVSPQLRRDRSTGALDFYVVPGSLLGAMWLQFTDAIAEKKRYERCVTCKTPFEISTGPAGFRTNRRYCSEGCRFKAHYERLEKARQLHSRGISPKEIAQRVDSDVKTVRGWLQSAKQPRKKQRRR